jgi:hypothetical protein
VTGAVLFAAGWSALVVRAFASRAPQPLGATPLVGVCLAAILAGFAVWVAFGRESWHVEPNRLEHRVGIGSLRRVRSYRDAEIAVTPFANRWGRLFIRLFVIDGKGRHFLVERSPDEGRALADFVCREAKWKRVDLASVALDDHILTIKMNKR